MASGINSTFRQVGIATGIAGLGAIFQHTVTQGTTTALLASGRAQEVLSAAHGHLATLLESGEVGHIAHSLSPATSAALNARLPRGIHRSLHPDRHHCRGRRPRRRRARLRAGPQPRLRLSRRGARRSRDASPSRAPRADTGESLSACARLPVPLRIRAGRAGNHQKLFKAPSAHIRDRRARASAGNADKLDPRASACTARRPSRACFAPPAGASTCRTVPLERRVPVLVSADRA